MRCSCLPTYFVTHGDRIPLGATFDGFSTNFAIYSQVAEAVDLCLFDGRHGF